VKSPIVSFGDDGSARTSKEHFFDLGMRRISRYSLRSGLTNFFKKNNFFFFRSCVFELFYDLAGFAGTRHVRLLLDFQDG